MPSDRRTLNALYDIRDNILLVRAFVDGLTFDMFETSRLHVYAASRALEIISEASRRLPDELKHRPPDLPWRAIRDVGNVYRHKYENVIERRVWDTVHNELEPLFGAVDAEIGIAEGGTPGL